MPCAYCNICNIWFLDATFPNRRIGRDDLTPWPPRSPDITPLDNLLLRYVKDKVFSTPVPDITNLKGKNNRHFWYNNWRHVGEHVERNWLSIRRPPCNKRSTCWSVLMCCKKLIDLRFKNLYSTYSSFLVINVCNQGKILCSPCVFFPRPDQKNINYPNLMRPGRVADHSPPF